MNATNRVINRIILILAAIVFAALAAAFAARAWAPEAWQMMRDSVHEGREWIDGYHFVGQGFATSTAVLCVVAVIAVVLAVWFLATRGGGHTSTVFMHAHPAGDVNVDRDVADAVLAGPLRERSDVLSAETSSFLVRKQPTIRLTVRLRNGADIAKIIDAVQRTTQQWDELTATQMPIVLHFAERHVIDSRRADTRVA